MKIHRVIWERYDVNSYIIEYDELSIMIDCNNLVYDYLIKNNLIPDYIFITHEHFDHIEGLDKVRNIAPHIKVIASKEASINFLDTHNNLSYFLEDHIISESRADIEIIENTSFIFNNKEIKCYLTAGHTVGCMVISIDNMLFTGDTVLNNVKTPKNLPSSSKEQLINSLDFIDNTFDEHVIFYPGHSDLLLKKDWNKAISLGKV